MRKWVRKLTQRRATCPHCRAEVAIVKGRFVAHGTTLFRCPLSGTIPSKAIIK